MKTWLKNNKEWVFGGIGVAILLLLLQGGYRIYTMFRQPPDCIYYHIQVNGNSDGNGIEGADVTLKMDESQQTFTKSTDSKGVAIFCINASQAKKLALLTIIAKNYKQYAQNLFIPSESETPPEIVKLELLNTDGTSTPTDTPAIDNNPTMYDDFNNSEFDGKWNTDLWTKAETATYPPGYIEQQEGVLVAKSEATFAGISSDPNANFKLSEIDFVEANLMLDEDFEGEFGLVSLGLISNNTDFDWTNGRENWWLTCQIETCKTADWCNSPDKPQVICFSPNGYEAGKREDTEYNTWHTLRIKPNPETVTFDFYLDGNYFDSYTPPNAEELKDDSFRVIIGSFTNPNSSAVGYLDDVRIVEK